MFPLEEERDMLFISKFCLRQTLDLFTLDVKVLHIFTPTRYLRQLSKQQLSSNFSSNTETMEFAKKSLGKRCCYYIPSIFVADISFYKTNEPSARENLWDQGM